METYEQKVAWLKELSQRINGELADKYQQDPVSAISQTRLAFYFDDFTNDFVHLRQWPKLHNVRIEDVSSFVLEIMNNGVVSNSFDNGLTNRSMSIYDLVDSLCNFFIALEITSSVMIEVVNRVITDGYSLTGELYRNIAIVKDKMNDSKYTIFYKSQKPGQEVVVYEGVRYYRYLKSKNDRIRDYFKTNTNGDTKYLQRELWKKYFGEIPENHFIGFKDGNKSNLSIHNLKAIPMGEQINNPIRRKNLSGIMKRVHELSKLGLGETEMDRQLMKDWIDENRSLVTEILNELAKEDKELTNRMASDLIRAYDESKVTA